jgi:hypothetical protein
MHQQDYRLIAEHPLRNVLRSVCNDPRDMPGKKDLRAQLVEALPDAAPDVIDALMTKCEGWAKAAVDPGARFDLRAGVDQVTLQVLKTYEAADRLVPLPEEGALTPDEAHAIVDGMDSWVDKAARAIDQNAAQFESAPDA